MGVNSAMSASVDADSPGSSRAETRCCKLDRADERWRDGHGSERRRSNKTERAEPTRESGSARRPLVEGGQSVRRESDCCCAQHRRWGRLHWRSRASAVSQSSSASDPVALALAWLLPRSRSIMLRRSPETLRSVRRLFERVAVCANKGGAGWEVIQ
jgi:hypothetical protein